MNLFKLFEDAALAAVKPRGRVSKRNPANARLKAAKGWGCPRIRLPAPFQANIHGMRVQDGQLINRTNGTITEV